MTKKSKNQIVKKNDVEVIEPELMVDVYRPSNPKAKRRSLRDGRYISERADGSSIDIDIEYVFDLLDRIIDLAGKAGEQFSKFIEFADKPVDTRAQKVLEEKNKKGDKR